MLPLTDVDALLTSTSSPPKASTAACTAPLHPSAVKRSTATAFALTPLAAIFASASASAALSRPQIDVRTFFGEGQRDAEAHAAVSTGDQYGFALQIEIHVPCPFISYGEQCNPGSLPLRARC